MARAEDGVALAVLDAEGRPGAVEHLDAVTFPERVGALERRGPRWVWADTATLHPRLLRAGVSVGRVQDLRLCHAVLRRSRYLDSPLADDERWRPAAADTAGTEPSLLDLPADPRVPDLHETVAEHARQTRAVEGSERRERLRLLLAAESAGALVAAELSGLGLPFDEAVHRALLTRLLGPQPLPGGRPARLEALVEEIRRHLEAPGLNPDSAPELLRALHRQGLSVDTTRQGELERLDHPVVAPLLEYKKLARLLSANGWGWLASWVHDGRFRPDYLPSGVVTGRWAARGGGALQLPKQVRSAVRRRAGSSPRRRRRRPAGAAGAGGDGPRRGHGPGQPRRRPLPDAGRRRRGRHPRARQGGDARRPLRGHVR